MFLNKHIDSPWNEMCYKYTVRLALLCFLLWKELIKVTQTEYREREAFVSQGTPLSRRYILDNKLIWPLNIFLSLCF